MDYELYNYGSHSEIRAIPENGPQQLVATFPDHDAACIGWDQIMDTGTRRVEHVATGQFGDVETIRDGDALINWDDQGWTPLGKLADWVCIANIRDAN